MTVITTFEQHRIRMHIPVYIDKRTLTSSKNIHPFMTVFDTDFSIHQLK